MTEIYDKKTFFKNYEDFTQFADFYEKIFRVRGQVWYSPILSNKKLRKVTK